MPTTGSDLLIAMWRTLDRTEREDAFAHISDLRLIEKAGEESTAGRLLRSLRRVVEVTGPDPSPDAYKAARVRLLSSS